MTNATLPAEIPLELMEQIVDQALDGAIEDASIIQDIYRVIVRHVDKTQSAATSRWVSVSEALPPNGQRVEVRGQAVRTGGKRSTLWVIAPTLITHWRPAMYGHEAPDHCGDVDKMVGEVK